MERSRPAFPSARRSARLRRDDHRRSPDGGRPGYPFGADQPKQYLPLLGRPVLRHAAEALLAEGGVALLQPVCAPGEEARVAAILEGLPVLPIQGGETRQASVRAGLEALARRAPAVVLVHDAAQPGDPARHHPGAARGAGGGTRRHPGPAGRRHAEAGRGRRYPGDLIRAGLFRAQTPQAFRFPDLLAAHRAATAEATDDAQLLELAGARVALIPGAETNIKITFPEDLARVEAQAMTTLLPRIGTGFDVHRTEIGRPMVICGVTIPCEFGLEGHSDADVGIHALCDAIYGALAEGDIGRWFPPSGDAVERRRQRAIPDPRRRPHCPRGGVLANCDVTILCERPKIGTAPGGDAGPPGRAAGRRAGPCGA